MKGKKGSNIRDSHWLCRCRSCNIIYNLPRAGTRPLMTDIGKAKCPDCGGFLVRTNRNTDLPIRTITREQAKLT